MPIIQDKIHPTTYEIVVAGCVNEERAAWFGDMTLTVRSTDDGKHTTVLSGPFADQAALFGILGRIRDMGLKLLSLTALGFPPHGGAHTDSD